MRWLLVGMLVGAVAVELYRQHFERVPQTVHLHPQLREPHIDITRRRSFPDRPLSVLDCRFDPHDHVVNSHGVSVEGDR